MPLDKLRKYLDSENVKYVCISHSPAFTAQEIAASAHVPGRELAKTVMVKLDGRIAMVVLPASEMVDLKALQAVSGAKKAVLAAETDFRHLFPDCEVGAMPPFGNLYDMEVFVSPTLTEDEEIAFNAGSHVELVRLAWRDFERLVKPQVVPVVASAGG